jgi:peptidoglycan/LPS O-acetylase OafA/YrhL
LKANPSTLVDYDGSRDNNFTIIRIFLAWSVLYGHSYAVSPIAGISDPLNQIFQGSIWIGEFAVNGFFAISGFLVAASLIKRGIIDYVISRVLRIYPALIVCVFVSVFILGPLFTSLSLSDYFDHPRTWSYLNNAFAIFKMQWTLPGVFEQNSRDAFNGSLWTLTVEVRCYILLAAMTFLGFRLGRLWGNTLVLIVFAIGVMSFESIPLLGINPRWSRPALYFIIGVFLFLNREKVLLDRRIALLAAILAFFSFGEDWFGYIFPPAITYLIFFLAYTTKPIRADAVVGDISYGIYIYAWPCQQIVAYLFPDQTPYFNVLVSSVIVIPLAWISWHYAESRVLTYKKIFLGHADPKKLLQRIKTILAKKMS